MMPTDGQLSSVAHFAPWKWVMRGPYEYTRDYERAGNAVFDGTLGLDVRQWYCESMLDKIYVWADGIARFEFHQHSKNIVEVCLAFDQNMSPFAGWVDADGDAFYRWYDSLTSAFEITQLPAGSRSLRCCIDEHRREEGQFSDVVLAYIRGERLYVRYQRERYGIEHEIKQFVNSSVADAELVAVGMNNLNRLQFMMRNAVISTGSKQVAEPYLNEVVTDLLRRSGVPAESIDTSDLYEPILGYKVATQAGADALLQPLRSARFFDVSEYDKKIRFPKRGGPSVASLTVDDYLEADGSPVNLERVQEAELLRKVNLTYIDPAASYGPMTQAAERRSNTVLAKAEANSELPITMGADEAATVASRRLKVAWGELHKGDFDVGVPWSRLTPADVVEVTDKRGVRFRMRVLSITEDSGQFSIEAIEDADWAYLSTAKGVTPVPPQPTTPGLVGDTQIVIMNLPALRGVDNVPGVYIAGYGTGSGWVGVEYWLSADGGQTYQPIGGIDIPANIGQINGAQAVSADPLNVLMLSGELSSATSAQLAARQNAIAIGSGGVFEIAQFENATETTADQYTLDTIAYNLLGTTASAHADGDPVVLLDDAVTYCPIDRAFAGQTLLIKPVSFGQTLDEVTAVSFTYNPIINPPLFYRRDDILAVGGETTVTMDKVPTGLQILANGILLTSGYTLSGNVATLATPATAGDEYTIIYFSEENPAATTLT